MELIFKHTYICTHYEKPLYKNDVLYVCSAGGNSIGIIEQKIIQRALPKRRAFFILPLFLVRRENTDQTSPLQAGEKIFDVGKLKLIR